MHKPIYLITDSGKLRKEGKLLWAIEEAFIGAKGKVGFLQIREQVRDGEYPPVGELELVDLIAKLKELCEKYGVNLLINSRVDLVQDYDLDGVHLGKNSSSIASARAKLGANKLIGYSAHSEVEVQESFDQGADYVFLSPIFKPLSKIGYASELGLEELRRVCSIFPDKKIFALGGITEDNFMECMRTGASGIALISSILLANDPKKAMEKFDKL